MLYVPEGDQRTRWFVAFRSNGKPDERHPAVDAARGVLRMQHPCKRNVLIAAHHCDPGQTLRVGSVSLTKDPCESLLGSISKVIGVWGKVRNG